MSIQPYQPDWLIFLKDIDIKAYDWPWCDEGWDDISQYIIRVFWERGVARGFSVFQFHTNGTILISKLTAHPMYRRQLTIVGELLIDIEDTAKRRGFVDLRMTIWEHDNFRIKEAKSLGFRGVGLRGKYPDGSDGWEFMKGQERIKIVARPLF